MRRTREEWERIVERYEASGLTARLFCRQAGLGERSLWSWIQRLGKSRTGAIKKGAPSLIEVGPRGFGRRKKDSTGPSSQGLIVRFPGGATIEVLPDTDRKTLAWVLTLMGGVA